jgi:hypothetical protein
LSLENDMMSGFGGRTSTPPLSTPTGTIFVDLFIARVPSVPYLPNDQWLVESRAGL